jgi:hypothetical protein
MLASCLHIFKVRFMENNFHYLLEEITSFTWKFNLIEDNYHQSNIQISWNSSQLQQVWVNHPSTVALEVRKLKCWSLENVQNNAEHASITWIISLLYISKQINCTKWGNCRNLLCYIKIWFIYMYAPKNHRSRSSV